MFIKYQRKYTFILYVNLTKNGDHLDLASYDQCACFIISFHREKFLPSNFLISQLVSDNKAIVLLEVFVGLVFSFSLFPLFILTLCGFQFILIPLVDTGGACSTTMCSHLIYCNRLCGSMCSILLWSMQE